jgi:hypothetical protein
LDVNFFEQGGSDVAMREVDMPSWISCLNGHSTKSVSVQQAAIALSEGRTIGACKKCGKELQYRISHTYADDRTGKEYSFVATRAVRLRTRIDSENYDPFLLVLREIDTGKEQILPTFWAHGKSGTQRGGQFPPLLTLEEWKALFRKLDSRFEDLEQRIRGRAYELYEKRGKGDGHALDDWLQAKAELTGREALPVAA